MNNHYLSRANSAVWTGIVTDFILAVFKGAAGYLSGSRALLGDALHSAANGAVQLAKILPAKEASSRADQGAANGRNQFDPFIYVLVPALIFMGGLHIGTAVIRDVITQAPAAPKAAALGAVLMSIAFNEAVFQYQYYRSKRNKTNEHKSLSENHKFGLYCSLIVLIGITVSMIGADLNLHPLLYTDSAAALIVSFLVIRKGCLMISGSTAVRRMRATPNHYFEEYMDTIQRVHGVITVEKLRVQERAQHAGQVNLDIEITVNPRISVWEAHEIAERVQKLLQHRFIQVGDARVVVIPYEPGYPYKTNFDLLDNDLPTLPQ